MYLTYHISLLIIDSFQRLQCSAGYKVRILAPGLTLAGKVLDYDSTHT